MSTFEDGDYKWRETYFVLFQSDRRPTVEQVRELLQELNPRFELTNVTGDEEGRFDSLTLRSPQDNAALDISYLCGAEALEQGAALAKELKTPGMDAHERAQLAKLTKCDARFDIMHFERVADVGGEEEDDMLDPSALLIVLDALVDLTDGAGVDPQTGLMM